MSKEIHDMMEIEKNIESKLFTTEEMISTWSSAPSSTMVLRLELQLEGEIITKVIPHIGYLHRCFEKHAEAMTYPQVIPYTDRMDYLASMGNEFGYVLAVEKLLGIEVPQRVEYIRVIMAELQRIASHLVALGTYGADIGAFTPFLFAFRDREKF
jgi:NADH-quinone oxidoreductase subunit D